MALDPQFVGVIQILPGVVSLAFLRPALANRDKPGSRWFAVIVCAIALWSFGLGFGKFLPGSLASQWAYNLVLLAVEVVGVAWFLVAVEVTEWLALSRRLVAGLAGWLVAIQALLWTNPLHHLAFTEATTMSGTVIVPAYGVGFWIHTAGTYLLVAAATGLLAAEAVRSSGLRRRQTGLLAVAAVPSVLANVVTLSDAAFAPYDVTPFGFLLTAGLFAMALFSGRFLDIVPVARRTAMAEMDDAVVTLDDEDRVVDCNAAARRLFDIDGDCVGTPVAELLDPVPADVLATVEDATAIDTQLRVPIDGEQRHFHVSVSPVNDQPGRGRVIVLREITLLKEREQQLDLMRQVQSRVLRHNLRNELQTVKLANELIADEVDGRPGRLAARTVETVDDLIAVSEKVRTVERVVERDETAIPIALPSLLRDQLAAARREFPAVSFTLDSPEQCAIEAPVALEAAFANLIENAAEHNDADEPAVGVTVTADDDAVAVTVSDNGSGISAHELDVLERNAETPLEHGSGMGLWVVEWIVDSTRGRISYDTGPGGTAITVHVPTDLGGP
jgi:signal transduction histidine kinase